MGGRASADTETARHFYCVTSEDREGWLDSRLFCGKVLPILPCTIKSLHVRVSKFIILYFSARWHFTTNKALSCHNNWFIWVAIHCQMQETFFREREIVSSVTKGMRGGGRGAATHSETVSCIFFPLSAPRLLSPTPSAPSPVLHHCVIPGTTTVPPPHFSLQSAPLEGTHCSFISPGSTSKWTRCVVTDIAHGFVCAHLLAWKLE